MRGLVQALGYMLPSGLLARFGWQMTSDEFAHIGERLERMTLGMTTAAATGATSPDGAR
jgi:hypothetical protein